MKLPPYQFRIIVRTVALVLVMCGLSAPGMTQIKFGNSYVNLSKKTIGGTVEPGDTLEIRTNIYFPANFNSGYVYSVRYVDNVPTNTAFADDSLRLITNEGLTYKRWTLAANDDPGTYRAAPPAGSYNVKINLGKMAGIPNGTTTNTTGSGRVDTDGTNKDRPVAGGNTLLTTSFKVRVTGNIGDTITLGAGRILYRLSSSTSTDQSQNAIQYKILISTNDPICPNSIGKNFVAESGGTFDSGAVQNRSYSPTFLIPGYTYRNNVSPSVDIGDGTYGIVNNLSPTGSTYQNARKNPYCSGGSGQTLCSHRMFNGHWDIIGDHTSSITPAGNVPVAPGSSGGYMLVVNADYATSEAYRQTITGLCPNTSYEFSLWVRNVCTNCGADSTGTQTFTPGVYPNLSFAIDGLDRYSSGQIDTIGWQKKGFLFKTGLAQTSVIISIRNNASGGGGNDWAIDDIALATCNPNLNLVPSGNAQVCYNNQVDISSTVTSFFNNYTHFRFERSIDDGATWTTSSSGTAVPNPVSGGYEYTAQMVPSFLADNGHHLNQYRFLVASSADNLTNSDCSFMASTTIVVMVNNCSVVLSARDTSEQLQRITNRLGNKAEISRLANPFSHKISFDLITPQDSPATIYLMDNHGRPMREIKVKALKGYNHIILDQLHQLAKGTYYLRVQVGSDIFNRIVMKTN